MSKLLITSNIYVIGVLSERDNYDMKILYVTTIGTTMSFFRDFIEKLVEEGHEVDIACNENISPVPDFFKQLHCRIHKISCLRKPWSFSNVKAIKEIKSLVIEQNYDIVHCHTPIAAMCTRVACRSLRKNVKVVYTAHGFHFFKGAPMVNWLIYYPIEWICSFFTDVLITINNEDYARAKKHMHAKKIEYIPGIGVDTEAIDSIEISKTDMRKELNIPETDIVILSVGELNDNKNQEIIIRAISKLDNNNITYVLCGIGDKEKRLSELSEELSLQDKVKLLGYRNDVMKIYKCADIFAFPSKREGLGLAALEAMSSGLPIITSNVHGIRDYSDFGKTGYNCSPNDIDSFAKYMKILAEDEELRKKMGLYCTEVAKKFDIKNTNVMMKKIYENVKYDYMPK